MAHSLSPQASDLLDRLPDLSHGLKANQPGAREALLGVCSSLISELSRPAESLQMLLWAQVCTPYLTLIYPPTYQTASLTYLCGCG